MILTDEKALRVKCEDVKPEEVDDIREALEKELKASENRGVPGIGLAAPQIGIPKRMAIIRFDDFSIDLVNATIGKGYDELIFDNEGCLSFPGKLSKTRRYNEVHILDNDVEPHRFVATGILAVACQHEINHLDGILLPDVEIKSDKNVISKNKTRPNDPCICGSGKKYKKCCA
jgi:peptide deformylase